MKKNNELDKIIKEMRDLRDKRIDEIQEIHEQTGGETNKEEISKQITIKYLGKMELVNEQGELAEKDVFMTVEEIDGQYQIRYYDESQRLLGIQRTMDKDIILSSDFSEESIDEQKRIQEELDKKEKEEAKTLEELEEEQKKQQPETQVLPGVEETRLSKKEVDSMRGPKIRLNTTKIEGQTLGNVIGLEGDYIKFVDADKVRELFPELEVAPSQRTVPIEIDSDGSANIIGNDILELSRQEGINSTEDYITMNNEGTITNEQNIETFNIVKQGKMHTIAIGYDENAGGYPLEAKYGRRDIDDTQEISYIELETVHEGPINQDDAAYQKQMEASGIYKGEDIIEETIEEYAKAMNIKKVDEYGYPTNEYDYDLAKKELEEKWSEQPDATLEELIEDGQKQYGPEDNRRW